MSGIEFRRLIAVLRDIERHVSNIKTDAASSESARMGGSSQPATDRSPIEVSVAWSEQDVGRHNADQEFEGKFREKSLRVQWAIFGATVLAFCAAAYYARVAKITLDQIVLQTPKVAESADAAKKSTDLTFIEARNTQGANIDIQFGISQIEDSYCIKVLTANMGHVMAEKVHGSISFIVEPIDSDRRLHEDTVLVDSALVNPTNPLSLPNSNYQTFCRTWIDSPLIDSLEQLKIKVRMVGEWTYGNGFGDLINGSSCQVFFARTFHSRDSATKSWSPPDFGTSQCDQFEPLLRHSKKMKKIVEEEAREQIEKENLQRKPN